MGFFVDFKNYKNKSFDTSAHEFDAFINLYLREFDGKTENISENFRVAMIASSPSVEVAKAVARYASEFSKRDIKVRAIFASLDPKEDLLPWLKNNSLLSDCNWLDDIRWASKRELMDAHEQIILGTTMCWSGDAMRRQSRAPYLMDLFENNCEVKTRMGRLAFEALWSVSVAVPNSKYRQSSVAQAPDKKTQFQNPDYRFFYYGGSNGSTRH